MTREEAIQIIKNLPIYRMEQEYDRKSDLMKALQMAIESLENTGCSVCTRRNFYQIGYQDGINADKWIPCSERLPVEEYERAIEEEGDSAVYPVLVTVKELSFEENRYINVVKQAWFFEMFDYLGFYDSDCHEVEAIAWQPLPEPYKEGET
jgi:hypothetical protein